MTSTWRRFIRLGAGDRALAIEALTLLLAVRIGLRILPFAAMQRKLARRSMPGEKDEQPVDRVAWAVKAVARRVPGTTCLVEALVVDSMLRRHGHTPTFRIGVREGRSSLEAHAWVECDGTVVIGAVENLADHAVLS